EPIQSQNKSFHHEPCDPQSYPVLDIVSNAYPEAKGRLLTYYSPVRHSSTPSKLRASAFDLHVLSTPPAFVLSQDQTLRKKPNTKPPQNRSSPAKDPNEARNQAKTKQHTTQPTKPNPKQVRPSEQHQANDINNKTHF